MIERLPWAKPCAKRCVHCLGQFSARFQGLRSEGHFHTHCADEENEASGRLRKLLRRVIWQSQDLHSGLSTILPLPRFSPHVGFDTGV